MPKYKHINRKYLVHLAAYESMTKWLDKNDRRIITFKDLWDICEGIADKIEADNHLITKSIRVIDEPMEKTLARIDKILKEK